jgi:probable rRNA maturation factor
MTPKPKSAKRAAITIVVEETSGRAARAVPLIRRAAALALAENGKRRRSLTILLTNDARLKALNAQFRGKNRVTNVLSFPSADPAYLGDVALAYGLVAREARQQGKKFPAHAAHLAAHGVLHLVGHDHENPAEALVMEGLERRILARLKLADPYAADGKTA